MLANKSTTPDINQKYITPREKKIGDLALVLEKQRKAIKSLLENQNTQKDAKRNQSRLSKMQPKDQNDKKEPQKYQQLCNQILDIGNRVLNSYRKPTTLQTYREDHVSVQTKEQKQNTTDKQIQYLKSDEYKLYLQNLSKESDSSKTDLLKRMKQTRNNNVYTKTRATEKLSNDNSFKISERKTPRQQRELEFISKRNIDNVPKNLNKNIEIKGWRRENNRITNIFQQISLFSSNQNKKSMAHSPTMKDIAKPSKILKTLVAENEERSTSNNNKIQSKTVQCIVFIQNPQKKPQIQSNVENNKQICESPKFCRHFKQWNLNSYKVVQNTSAKGKKCVYEKSNNCYKKQKQQHALKECCSAVNINRKIYKPQVNYTANKPINHYTKNEKQVIKSYKNYRLESQSSKQNQMVELSEISEVKVQKINLYKLSFKLADPKIRPSYSQSKISHSKKTQNKSSWQIHKQNEYQVENNNYRKQFEKYPLKQLKFNVKQYDQMPIFSNDNGKKRWKFQESQATSTVTKSGQEQQIGLKAHSRSKSKLSVVTTSKKEKR